jgi:F-type H+-transporting ATPase subunit alpha
LLERAAKMAERWFIVPKGTKVPPGDHDFRGVDGQVYLRDDGREAAEKALHARKDHGSLELAKDPFSGGSLTALPIVETQAGDVSAYIPTNVISITDGQMFLEGDLFFSGVRPAINVGISVSRVGGNAQTKAMKKIAGTLRLDLAQYREMAAFAQFASDLDPSTRRQLERGQRLVELLKQGQYVPMSVERQILVIYAGTNGYLDKIPVEAVREYEQELLKFVDETQPDLWKTFVEEKQLSDKLKGQVEAVLKTFAAKFVFSGAKDAPQKKAAGG